jgi:predicted NACHT family NTPase
MIAIVNHSSELPTRRAGLYEECSRLLLESWKAEEAVQAVREATGMSITLFTRNHKEALLADLAWRMQQAGELANIVQQDVLEAVVLHHVKRRRLRQAEPELVMQALITQLRERHNVICWLGGQLFAFVHRTFMEYYAAMSCSGNGLLVTLVKGSW